MSYDTYCGLYCGACIVLAVNVRGTLEETAKEWGVNPEDLICTGCKTEQVSSYCRKCQIKNCAQERGVEFCFECSAYPCQIVNDFKNDDQPHHSIIFHNLNLIKEKGLEQWLLDQKQRWSCPECGETYSWYDKQCSNCGGVVKNSISEERELTEKDSENA